MERIPDEDFGRRVMENLLNIYVTPEVKRRQESGKLPKQLYLHAAQIVFYPDGRTHVRINDEVRAIAQVKLKAGISKKKGEPIYAHELEGLDEIRLTDMDDPNAGHTTLIRIGDRWTVAFDFVYNKAASRKHVEAAKQFYDAAYHSYHQKNWLAFVDNLFSAAELVAKVPLLSSPDPRFLNKATHIGIQTRYNRFADLGNVDTKHRKVFNKLSGLRPSARYLKGHLAVEEKEAEEMLLVVKEMIEYAEKYTGH